MAVSILINGNPGPATAAAYGDEFTFANNDDTGVVSWQWTIADKPAGSAATLTTPTGATCKLTVDVEGTYLVRLTVNADAQQTNTAAVVFPARIASKSPNAGGANLRYPAASENEEVQAGRGWAEDINKWLELVNKDQILPRKVAVYTSEVFKGPGRIMGETVTVAGAGTLPRATAANAAYQDRMPCTIFFEENTTLNGISYGILFGPVNTTTDLTGLNVGDPVYVDGNGNVSTSPGAVSQVIGYVITSLPPSRIMFHPTLPALYHGQAPGGFTHALATEHSAGFLSPVLYSKLLSYPDANLVPMFTLAPPQPVGAASSPGGNAGRTTSYSDHIHAHGNQAGGSLHALASQSVAGFIAPADKKKLDDIQISGFDPTIGSGTLKTIYVRTTGNDTTGDGTLSKPYRTYIRAIKDVPLDIINTIYTIDITGIGTEVITSNSGYIFPAFRTNAPTDIIRTGGIKVHADLEVIDSFDGTIITNTASDIYGSLAAVKIDGRNWTPNEHAGRLIGSRSVLFQPYGVIISNTADTLQVLLNSGPVTTAWGILDRTAKLSVTYDFNISHVDSCTFENIEIDAYSLNVFECNGINFRGVKYTGQAGVTINASQAYISYSYAAQSITVDRYSSVTLQYTYTPLIRAGYFYDANISAQFIYTDKVEVSADGVAYISTSHVKAGSGSGNIGLFQSVIGDPGVTFDFTFNEMAHCMIYDVDTAGNINFNISNGSQLLLGIYPNANTINIVADDQSTTWAEFDDASSPWYHVITGRYGSKVWSGL